MPLPATPDHPAPSAGRLNLERAGRHLGVSRETIRRWVHEGRLSGLRIGRQVFVDVAELEALVQPVRGSGT
jgi:excisionase family DNA binding protein